MTQGDAMGAVEYYSIGVGLKVCDAMLKKANVRLILSKSICPGKYICVVTGSVEDVNDAIATCEMLEPDAMVDSLVLTNPHPSITSAITQTSECINRGTLGVVESFNMCSSLVAADAAAKKADVSLIEIRLAIMIAGKSFITFTGDEAAVSAAVEVAAEESRARGMLVSAVVIPRPHEEMLEFLL